MHASVCEHLSQLNWPDHQICMTALYKSIDKSYEKSYMTLEMKRANGDSAEDKKIPDIMLTKTNKSVFFDYCNTIHPVEKYV